MSDAVNNATPFASVTASPQPRSADTREDPRYFEHVTEVRELLRGVGADEHGSVLAEETA